MKVVFLKMLEPISVFIVMITAMNVLKRRIIVPRVNSILRINTYCKIPLLATKNAHLGIIKAIISLAFSFNAKNALLTVMFVIMKLSV